jgi:hypothetical protein
MYRDLVSKIIFNFDSSKLLPSNQAFLAGRFKTFTGRITVQTAKTQGIFKRFPSAAKRFNAVIFHRNLPFFKTCFLKAGETSAKSTKSIFFERRQTLQIIQQSKFILKGDFFRAENANVIIRSRGMTASGA